MQGDVGDQKRVHIAAVVADHHHAALGVVEKSGVLVDVADMDPMGGPDEVACDPVVDAKIEEWAQRRHDAARVGAGAFRGRGLRLAARLGDPLDHFEDLLVVGQLVDHGRPAHHCKRGQVNRKGGVDGLDHAPAAPAEVAADSRECEVAHACQYQQSGCPNHKPDWNRNRVGHRSLDDLKR